MPRLALAVVAALGLILVLGFWVLRVGLDRAPWAVPLVALAGSIVQGWEGLATDGDELEEGPGAGPPSLTHGVASGDVTATSAVLWARASGPALVNVEYAPLGRSSPPPVPVVELTDYAAVVPIGGLDPDTEYVYRVWASDGHDASEPRLGRFRTAPSPSARRSVSFVFGGDLGGSSHCRRADSGYPIFSAMHALSPDFFLALGDMVYADDTCPATGPGGAAMVPGRFPGIDHPAIDWADHAAVRNVYLRHWRYNRADPHLQRLLASTPIYAQWDDHEVINNFGGSWSFLSAAFLWRAGYPNLVAAGRDAFFASWPVARAADDPNRLYRRFSWGAEADLFLLDTRSYRSRNDLADTAENRKTMLGAAQLRWLKEGLRGSAATWKIVASGSPISIPTSGVLAALFGRDGWASGSSWDYSSQTGFERELLDLIMFLDDQDIRNVVFVAADAHRALTIRYQLDPNGDGRSVVFHELVAGPLSARVPEGAPELDPTFNPVLLFHEAGVFNFGYVRIEPEPGRVARLVAEVRGEDGQPRPGSRVELQAR